LCSFSTLLFFRREAARKAEEEAQRRQEEAAEQRRRQLQAEEAKARKAAVEEEQRRAAKEAKVQERERRLAQARERLAEKEKEEKKRLLREKTKLVPVLQKCTASISSLAVLLDYEVVLSIVARNCDDEVIKAVDRSAFVVLLRAPPSSETVFKPARVLPSGAMEFVLKMSSLGTRVVAAYLNNVLIKSFEVQVTQRPAAAEYCKVSGVLAGQVGSVTWLTVKVIGFLFLLIVVFL
jgi:Skp family chaperone for outer membrane proteins